MALGSIPGEFSSVFRFSFRTENGWGGGGDIHCEIFHPPSLRLDATLHHPSPSTPPPRPDCVHHLRPTPFCHFSRKENPEAAERISIPAIPPPTRVKYPPPSSILLLLLLLRPHSLSIFGKARSPSFGAGPSAGWVGPTLFFSRYTTAPFLLLLLFLLMPLPESPPLPPLARAPACPKRGAAASSPVPDWADVSLEMERGFMGRPSPRAQGRHGERGERKGHRWNLSLSFSDKKRTDFV